MVDKRHTKPNLYSTNYEDYDQLRQAVVKELIAHSLKREAKVENRRKKSWCEELVDPEKLYSRKKSHSILGKTAALPSRFLALLLMLYLYKKGY
jgi:hypothetical protein